MREWQSQAHVKHYCRYHVVFVPKYRKKSIYGTLRKDIGGILRESPRGRIVVCAAAMRIGRQELAVQHEKLLK
jgi:putative transposase